MCRPDSVMSTHVTGAVCPSNLCTRYPLRFQRRAVLSSEPDAIVAPSGENTQERTWPMCPMSFRTSVLLRMSHTRTKLSCPPVTMTLLSGEVATHRTSPMCPRCGGNLYVSRAVSTSQTRMEWSSETETARAPSGMYRAAVTGAVCPRNVWSKRPDETSHTLIWWSPEEVMSWLPSGWYSAHNTGPACPLRGSPMIEPSSTERSAYDVSWDAETRTSPWGEKHSAFTSAYCMYSR
mmetsp:Transcript_46838/g.111539  ORF Transcript_46838/g.111539 Transcript_46838/m.111539 type:complete len:235 (+) Transcript_46838:257-961(+)